MIDTVKGLAQIHKKLLLIVEGVQNGRYKIYYALNCTSLFSETKLTWRKSIFSIEEIHYLNDHIFLQNF